MKLARLLPLFAAVVFVLVLGLNTSAQAQCVTPYGSAGFPNPGWLGYYGSPYSLGQIPVPPYFALHPPVYYSMPVARTYGYSPYAYPGSVRTPEIVTPEVIENPHAKPGPEPPPAPTPTALKTASVQIIENPFVRKELKTAYAAP
jgi:hypothetical protein